MNLKQRSYQKELLDNDHIPFADIKKNMEELDTINSLSGGHAITLKGFLSLLGNRKKLTVCEIGCGGGDNLQAIVQWCHKHQVTINCIGIDLKQECIDLARQRPLLQDNSYWIANDYAATRFDTKPDIIFSSLFCHHFTDEQLVSQLQWMRANSALGFFINDLHRHWLSYHFISLFSKLFSSSYLVKNDAPLSVRRGFVKQEWVSLCNKAGITDPVIRWEWAFRYLITVKHGV